MASVTYPSMLPSPTTAPLQPSERRLLTELPGLAVVRDLQRDWLATQRVEFVLSQMQADLWRTWWRSDLALGAAWFAADWPVPAGWHATAVRRFVDEPSWQFIPGYGWRVSGVCEIRGRGMLPDTDISNCAEAALVAMSVFDRVGEIANLTPGGATPPDVCIWVEPTSSDDPNYQLTLDWESLPDPEGIYVLRGSTTGTSIHSASIALTNYPTNLPVRQCKACAMSNGGDSVYFAFDMTLPGGAFHSFPWTADAGDGQTHAWHGRYCMVFLLSVGPGDQVGGQFILP